MRQVYITIKRSSGEVDKVDVTKKFLSMNDVLFKNVKKAVKESGQGECLSYEIVDKKPEPTKEELEYNKKVKWFKKHGFNERDVY